MIGNVESAIVKACQETGASVREFTGAPIFMEGNESGGHEWVFEFNTAPDSLEKFTQAFDEHLKQVNSDYEAKRYNNMTLKSPVIHKAPEGLFYQWMQSRGKMGGQNKVPRLSNDRTYITPILELVSLHHKIHIK